MCTLHITKRTVTNLTSNGILLQLPKEDCVLAKHVKVQITHLVNALKHLHIQVTT